MVKKEYDWDSAILDDHSKIKHKIFREYFKEYLATRFLAPQRRKFRLAVVEGFAGAGRYKHGEPGSPIIFMEALIKASKVINLDRAVRNLPQVEIECFFIFNDSDKYAIKMLQENLAPFVGEIKDEHPNLHVQVKYMSQEFEKGYPKMKAILEGHKITNVMFVLDQYGYSTVRPETINNIMTTWKSPEVFLTFAIEALTTYISTNQPENTLNLYPEIIDEWKSIVNGEQEIISKPELLGLVEKRIFEKLKAYAGFVSPFAIHNPKGWRYWLLHFSTPYKARQVYNDILHKDNGHMQVHFGHSGLNMFSGDPRDEDQAYFFGKQDQENSIYALHNDIPKMIALYDNAMNVEKFYERIYNETPAHSDDINNVLIKNDALEVITKNGGSRREAKGIESTDTVKLKKQRSFFLSPKV